MAMIKPPSGRSPLENDRAHQSQDNTLQKYLRGIVSMISLAVLSYERYCTMVSPTMADGKNFRPALGGICFSWLYSVAWTVPPLLGWSKYGPEGPGTTCSVDWRTQTANNISYIICLFTFCLVLPFGVILYSYGKLLHAIRQVSSVSSVVTRRREQRVLLMVVTMVVCYLLCWLPYGVAALIATFGPQDLLTAEASITPSLLAKFSTVVNPFIYIFMNKQTFSRVTKTPRTVRQEKEHPVPSQNSIHMSSEGANHGAPSPLNPDLAASYTPAANTLTPKKCANKRWTAAQEANTLTNRQRGRQDNMKEQTMAQKVRCFYQLRRSWQTKAMKKKRQAVLSWTVMDPVGKTVKD
ncbi:Pinopsin Pineal gland-specific opsin [Channa argus]|uniref:Pinopsin Pineal gland-specific opsin n=1 Tax=Channa argus TaxID=215402 RepID=A0A6G1QNB6_CHAAH|nr:Pinopsin Pineal gland-specific opsin [Channa argus]